jgi:cysteine-rich repeat protein
VYCGNGTTEAQYGEICDDGNLENADGCTSQCKISVVNPVSWCGNTTIERPNSDVQYEECDDGNSVD